MMNDNTLPPYRNTGAMTPTHNGLRALVDWVSVTFKTIKNLQEACQLLNLPIEEFTLLETGFNGYRKSAIFGQIKVAWDPPENTVDMGTHINMSGSACRQYEQYFDLKHNWSEFFALCMNFEHKFSRLDIAIDDFKGYFTVEQAYRCAKRGCMTATRVQKARTYEEFNLEDGSTFGRTLYIGKSDWIIRFYDKLPERLNKGIDLTDELKCWNRYEIQLRNKIATEAAHVLAYESYSLGEFVKGFMAAKIDFKINNPKDSHKYRWKSQKWWLKFLGDVEPLSLTQVAPDPSIERIGNWLNTQVDTSFATFLQAFDNDEIVIEYFKIKGTEKMKKEHDRMLKEFNKNKFLKKYMYNEMLDYVYKKRHSQPTTD